MLFNHGDKIVKCRSKNCVFKVLVKELTSSRWNINDDVSNDEIGGVRNQMEW